MRARALLLFAALAAGCSAPSSVRISLVLADDARAITSGPVVLNLYAARSRLFENRSIDGKLPGDVVVLVDDDVGEIRAFARVVQAGMVMASGTGKSLIPRGRQSAILITLSTSPLNDSDGDNVPDDIDDCPLVADTTQTGGCQGQGDLAGFGGDDGGGGGGDMPSPGDMGVTPCGNGTLEAGEACDDGAMNSDDPAKTATCTTQCKKRTSCGGITGAAGAAIDPATGHCYVLWPQLLNWAMAERDCLTRGGHLAAITSAGENDRIKALTFTTTAWIGAVNAPAAGQVTWSNGESNGFVGFRAGEPSLGATSCVVSLAGGTGWEDRPCGFPVTGAPGLMPASAASTVAYVCEHACGNGLMEPGEECDPPVAGSCTNTCRKVRTCTEAGGMTSPATGYCYFAGATPVAYATALTGTCPAGTHLATPNSPIEAETTRKVITTDSWIAVRAPATPGVFQFDVAGPTLQTQRYHGFVDDDPDQVTLLFCAATSKGDARGDGWRDRDCTNVYTPICQRE